VQQVCGLIYGTYTNLARGNTEDFAVHVRGQSNLGDWIWIMDYDGNIVSSKEICDFASPIVSIAYYDEWVYLNGGFHGPGSLVIDTITIDLPPIESTTFTLALDENLVARWVATDTTINNHDGRVVANSAGVFVYESVLEPDFVFKDYIKKFSHAGQLLKEIEAPVFSNSVAHYPDMEVNEELRDHIFEVIDNQMNDNDRYIRNLNQLPKEPFD